MLLAKLVVCCLAIGWTRAEEEVELDIPQGKLKGLKTETVVHQMPYYSFRGIPYAEPNIGRDKFRVAQAPEPWSGVYDATKHRSTCAFFCIVRMAFIGDDDCLFVNVYTPELNKDASKAVMVWFHAGGFYAGSGDDDMSAPDFLVEQDVVLVTLNYRVGAVGFLSTGDVNAPGNVGLKDMVAALRWVKENIEHFGGSPEKVTIFGTDAGGAAVQYLMMSPMAKGLFSNAIQQSGSVGNEWAFSYESKTLAFQLGETLGIHTTDTAELVDKLKDIPTLEILQASRQVIKEQESLIQGLHVFAPSVEPDVGQEIFLPDDPWELMRSGQVVDVPYLVGMTADESMLIKNVFISHMDKLNERFDNVVLPGVLNITDDAERQDIAKSVKKFYMDDNPLSADTLPEYIKLMSDVIITCGIAMSLRVISPQHKAPIYYYLFSYESPLGFMKNLNVFNVEEGVCHGDEIGYLFYSNFYQNVPEPGSPGEKITNIMTKMWTNFAKTGNPTSTLDDDVTTEWEPMGSEGNYLDINVQPTMKTGLFKERVDFWVPIHERILGDYA